jgi:hypothetical protein
MTPDERAAEAVGRVVSLLLDALVQAYLENIELRELALDTSETLTGEE